MEFEKLRIDAPEVEWLYSPDWVYHDYGNCPRHLQMPLPYRREWPEGARYPLILLIPGSAWLRQEMYNDVPKYARLAARGCIVAAMQYRESALAPFPAQVEDVANAVAFLRSRAELLHFDPERLFLMGNSSGGHVALMAALLSAHGLCAPPTGLRGVIAQSAPTDLLLCAQRPLPPGMARRPVEALLGVAGMQGNEALARRASCGMYITEDVPLPPVLLFHSEGDPVASVEHSRRLREALARTRHEVSYYELEGDAHGGEVFYSERVLESIQSFCEL